MPDPVIDTAHGKLRGASSEGVDVFRGVPYAASTAGANRFRPPQPAKPWPGVRDARRFGPSAPQAVEAQRELDAWYSGIEPVSEDCLSLNVYAPGPASGVGGTSRPVMVWLHGGSWLRYSASASGFDATSLAKAGDVVVVTLNHRLNVFGHVHLEDDDERFAQSSSAGLLDIVAALHWVRDNAARFGGDAGNVTVFGQSGGASKLLALLAFAPARGLFHKAVVQSCSGGQRIMTREEAARQARILAAKLGLARLTGERLQALPVEHLLRAVADIPNPFRPVIDGRNFDAHPYDAAAPACAAGVPMLIGNTTTETTYYLANDLGNFALDMPAVLGRLERFLNVPPVQAARIADAYRSHMKRAKPADLLIGVSTDYLFRRNTMRVADLQAAAAPGQVHSYLFDRRTPVMGGLLQSPHTSEVPFIFGTTAAARAMVGTGPDIPQVTQVVMGSWLAFARQGRPQNEHVPQWPAYTPAKRTGMILDAECRAEDDPGGPARAALASLPPYEYSMPSRELL